MASAGAQMTGTKPLDASQPPLIFGEVLFDRFPGEGNGELREVLGGAPFNVAWHLHAFGVSPGFISCIGEDLLGQRILAAMTEHGMDTSLVQQDATRPTGTVEVSLKQGEPSYDIIAERAYDVIDPAGLPRVAPGQLLYHGSLAARHAVSAGALWQLRATGGPAVFVDVNLRAPWWTLEQVAALLHGASWVKLNADELTLLAPAADSPEQRAHRLIDSNGLRAAFVTLGAEGALAVTAEGDCVRLPPPRITHFIDAVGAGDGFAAILILGLLNQWPLELTMERAQAFASAIVGQRGATSRDARFYRAFRQAWQPTENQARQQP